MTRDHAVALVEQVLKNRNITNIPPEDKERMIQRAMRVMLRDPDYPLWSAGNSAVKKMLGIEGRVPVRGMEPRIIQGWTVYVRPLTGEKPAHGKRHNHRIIAICPNCGQEMSAGRTHQHKCNGA